MKDKYNRNDRTNNTAVIFGYETCVYFTEYLKYKTIDVENKSLQQTEGTIKNEPPGDTGIIGQKKHNEDKEDKN